MQEPAAAARVVRALTSDRHIRLSALDASPLWDGVRRGHPQLEADACAVLVQHLAGTLLLQARTFFSERLQILVRTSGRAKAVVSDAWPEGDIRGVLDPVPGKDGAWLEGPGLVQVMRSTAGAQPYMGNLEWVEGSLAKQFEAYLQQSEQVQASVDLWCDPATGEAGGLLVEPMPGCPPDRLQALIDALDGLEVVPLWERTPDFLCTWINRGPGSEVLGATDVRYHCRCSRESLLQALAGFGAERLADMFKEDLPVDVRCDYCGAEYRVARADIPAGGDA
ncbi:Hsp33 family molecular chaperone HslO [Mesoterricola sediminis]|uniref:33 kDa chaperonin n=1 Tax=Mesoterricola sediminis TaxID=2927980 RepID=A0AA48KAT9_9BACT|nr:Hsp33 family molecular chaperone HslO [Mesoterricola sediminis]BDU75409.1 33 kDa chaperonin [Mesoterricola sediminis]